MADAASHLHVIAPARQAGGLSHLQAWLEEETGVTSQTGPDLRERERAGLGVKPALCILFVRAF